MEGGLCRAADMVMALLITPAYYILLGIRRRFSAIPTRKEEPCFRAEPSNYDKTAIKHADRFIYHALALLALQNRKISCQTRGASPTVGTGLRAGPPPQ